MPPRLAHRKSRKGCTRCKARKVKCTEERPTCAACDRHNLSCQYPETSNNKSEPSHAAGSDATSSATSSTRSVSGPSSPYSLEEDVDALDSEQFQRRLLELRLLYHYVATLAQTLPAAEGAGSSIKDVYGKDTVEMAFNYPFLLNTIFALAALHKTVPPSELPAVPGQCDGPVAGLPILSKRVAAVNGADGPFASIEYARAHRIYLNMAIRQQREELLKLGPANADAVCINSVLLSIIALKLLPENSGKQSYEPPVQWLSMSHSIATVIKVCGPLLPENAAMNKLMGFNEPDFRDKSVLFNFEHSEHFQAILEYPEQSPEDEETSQTYSLAVGFLGGIYRALQNKDPQRQIARRLMSTAPVLPKQFVTLVEQRRPRALVIVAHILSMAKYVEKYWFFRGTAEHEVHGVKSILPENWQWAMEWPMKMIETLSMPASTEYAHANSLS